MPYALASSGAPTGAARNVRRRPGRREIGADERGDMTAVRVILPRVVSPAALVPSGCPRAFRTLTGHHSPEGQKPAPEFAEEQQG